jgi:hypothetical protein
MLTLCHFERFDHTQNMQHPNNKLTSLTIGNNDIVPDFGVIVADALTVSPFSRIIGWASYVCLQEESNHMYNFVPASRE